MNINYKCGACGYEFSDTKLKVACPSCKKRKLEINEIEKPSKPFRKPSENVLDDDGRSPRVEEFQRRQLQFVDSPDVAKNKDDAKVKRLLKQGKAQRSDRRTESSRVKVKCGVCGSVEKIDPILYRESYTCNSCTLRRSDNERG